MSSSNLIYFFQEDVANEDPNVFESIGFRFAVRFTIEHSNYAGYYAHPGADLSFQSDLQRMEKRICSDNKLAYIDTRLLVRRDLL